MTDNDVMTLEKALFILRHGSAEGEHKYFEAIEIIENEINRQKAEIERLSDRNHKCIYLSDDETTEYCIDGPCPKFNTETEIKAEAVKEFAERLKEDISGHRLEMYMNGLKGTPRMHEITYECVEEYIDNLVKEMVGGNNGGE